VTKPMRAHHYAPIAPLDTEPVGPYTDPQQREEALRDALRGVDLGTYDERMIAWTLRTLDNSSVRVVVSWLERTRGAGMINLLDAEAELQKRRPNTRRFSA
jgi:hypothetical protein